MGNNIIVNKEEYEKDIINNYVIIFAFFTKC